MGCFGIFGLPLSALLLTSEAADYYHWVYVHVDQIVFIESLPVSKCEVLLGVCVSPGLFMCNLGKDEAQVVALISLPLRQGLLSGFPPVRPPVGLREKVLSMYQ